MVSLEEYVRLDPEKRDEERNSQLGMFIREYNIVAKENAEENEGEYMRPWISLDKLIAEGDKRRRQSVEQSEARKKALEEKKRKEAEARAIAEKKAKEEEAREKRLQELKDLQNKSRDRQSGSAGGISPWVEDEWEPTAPVSDSILRFDYTAAIAGSSAAGGCAAVPVASD